uniref:Trimeric intracellular cation channel type A n=3 Tax=Taeniopygia guttata TaxID=59729 RepID=H0YQD2_TAEGU
MAPAAAPGPGEAEGAGAARAGGACAPCGSGGGGSVPGHRGERGARPGQPPGRESRTGTEPRSGAAMDLAEALPLGELAAAFAALPVFPLFDTAYFIISVLYLKYEPGAVEMSRKSPFASWLCAMLHCFGSYILADLLLGEAPIAYFSHNSSVILATAVWYLIFFCPMNLFYKCVSFLPVKLIFVAMKEVVRVRKIAAGVHHAHHLYHHGWFVMMATGWLKGSGVALMSNFEQLLRGVWKPETNEILHMSFPTKASLYGTVLFTLQQTHWLPISEANLIFFFTMFMIVCKVFMTATHSHASPFAPLENLICPVIFGSVSSGHPSHHHDHHEVSHPPPPPPPAKSKEELNEGTRKRKAKKAE